MKIHEYQAKQIFSRYGIPVPVGEPAFQVSEVGPIAERLVEKTKIPVTVVKAQIHAGGRGKGGGVKLAKTPAEATELASKILGMQLVTKQTGPQGQKVKRLYVEQGLDIARELYLALMVDREARRIAIIASPAGGMDIEEVAEKEPEKLLTTHIDPLLGLGGWQARKIAAFMGIKEKETTKQFIAMLDAMVKCFIGEDASMVEVNPLVVTKQGGIVALDGKVTFDDNAQWRHKAQWAELFDPDEEDPIELEAKKVGISYVSLDGSIGCMVNGAGLAMATMDIIQECGGTPANFLDVGGGASEEQVKQAFRIILRSPKVKGIFVNIFGGIMRCDVVAQGIISASRELGLNVPLVVRLEGTNVEQGRKILDESGLKIQSASSMGDGAQKIVAAIKS